MDQNMLEAIIACVRGYEKKDEKLCKEELSQILQEAKSGIETSHS
jgi:hypothetical protein